MILVDFIAWLLFISLICFVIYRYIIIFNSSKGRLLDIEKREYNSRYHRKFTIIIYSHNNSSRVKSLLESFSKQNYEENNYSINVILDNCDEENTKLLEIIGGARLWRINTDIKPLGKYKSFAWLLERLRVFENTNAFLFIDGECKIKNDLLEKSNVCLNENAVIVGETVKRKNFLFNRIYNFRNKLINRITRHGRFYSSLGNMIDGDILLIKQEVLEKIEFESIDNGFEEYEYPVKLTYFKVPVVYSNEITVFKSQAETLKSFAIKDYKSRFRALRTFLNNFNLLFSKGKFSVKEYILSMIYPSGTVFLLYSFVLMAISQIYAGTYFSKFISMNILVGLIGAKIISDFYSIIILRGSPKEYYYAILLFLLSPVIYLRSVLTGFITHSSNKKGKEGFNPGVISFEKNIAYSTITNGKKEFPCELEVIKSDENAKVIFHFKDKKMNSSKQPRVSYAVEEIIGKLKKHGFSLKVCSNCGYFYFTESSAAHTDGEKGYCLYKNFKENSKEKEFMPVWGSCKNIIPSQARTYILQQLGIDKDSFKNK
ncbi:MAG TPA: glycosyltransferase family 2 protein [Candidatus Gastranaerophilales bacterium]|nr:glycosyltransferase family 2 protein [Candidatus Gastranaerophilales bacterium]